MAARKKAEAVEPEEVKAEEAEAEETVKAEPKKTSRKKEATIKAKVVAPYIDKYTDERHNAGAVVEVTEARFNEINAKNKHLKKF